MDIIRTTARWLDEIPYSLIALFLRIVAAHPFFVSGQTKIEDEPSAARFSASIYPSRSRRRSAT